MNNIKTFVRIAIRTTLLAFLFSLIVIVAWERVDDRIESTWHRVTTKQQPATTSSVVLLSEEERRIAEIKDTEEARKVLDAYAKGVYAEELRKKSEDLAQEARAVSFHSAVERSK